MQRLDPEHDPVLARDVRGPPQPLDDRAPVLRARLLARLAGVPGQAEDHLGLERREHLDRRAELVDPFRRIVRPGERDREHESVPGMHVVACRPLSRSFATDSASFDRSSPSLNSQMPIPSAPASW